MVFGEEELDSMGRQWILQDRVWFSIEAEIEFCRKMEMEMEIPKNKVINVTLNKDNYGPHTLFLPSILLLLDFSP